MQEFDIIRRYFALHKHGRDDVVLGSGDDCALLKPPINQHLASTVDALVAGVHFSAAASPESIGHKAMAVSLSDLAAMGAEPAWVVATLHLPSIDADWLERFAAGVFALLDQHQVALVGGDLVQGPLAVTTQMTGFVPPGKALLRSGAQVGDAIAVSGTVGDAGLALLLTQSHRPVDAFLQDRLDKPTPRVDIGLALRDLATSAIDVSDGLVADLGHLLASDTLGAEIHLDALPLSEAFRRSLPKTQSEVMALSAGDDYELCCTVSPVQVSAVKALGMTVIGTVTSEPGIRCVDAQGQLINGLESGYQHFS